MEDNIKVIIRKQNRSVNVGIKQTSTNVDVVVSEPGSGQSDANAVTALRNELGDFKADLSLLFKIATEL
jgi:hypothetical protein